MNADYTPKPADEIDLFTQEAPINEQINADPLMMAAQEMTDTVRMFLSEYIQLQEYTNMLVDENAQMRETIGDLEMGKKLNYGFYKDALIQNREQRKYIEYLEGLIININPIVRTFIGLPSGDPFIHYHYRNEDDGYATPDASTVLVCEDDRAMGGEASAVDTEQEPDTTSCGCPSPDDDEASACGLEPPVLSTEERTYDN